MLALFRRCINGVRGDLDLLREERPGCSAAWAADTSAISCGRGAEVFVGAPAVL